MSGIDLATRIARRHLALVDRLLPDRIVGFYVVGSTALGAYRDGRSDIDFVAGVDRQLSHGEVRRLRIAQLGSGVRSATRALAHGHLAMPGTVNGTYINADDLTRPVIAIRPIASHVGAAFHRDAAFDVNPVVWKELRDCGVPLRGPGWRSYVPNPRWSGHRGRSESRSPRGSSPRSCGPRTRCPSDIGLAFSITDIYCPGSCGCPKASSGPSTHAPCSPGCLPAG